MSDAQNSRPTPTGDGEAARAPRRWIPLALIGAAVLVVLVVVIAWTTSAANQAGPDASEAADPAASSSQTGSATTTTATDAADATSATASDDGSSDVRASSAPHPFDVPAEIAAGVAAEVSNITSVDGVGKGVGETSGPAIRFDVTITNDSASAIDLSFTTVLVDYRADMVPGTQMSGNTGLVSLPDSLGAGESATATYVFTVPAEERGAVRVAVDYLADVPLAIFAGAAPSA